MQNKRVPPLDKPQNFLCGSLEAALRLGILTPADVVDHFGVAEMITKVSDAEHRAEMLAALKQADADTARELEVEFAGVLLKTAVKVGRVTAGQICDAVGINGVVCYQPQSAVWDLLLKTDWPTRDEDPACRELMGKMLQLVIDLNLLDEVGGKVTNTHREIVLAITAFAIVEQMPSELVAAAWQMAMDKGEEGDGYTAVDALGVLTPDLLAKFMHLTSLTAPLHAVARKYGWEAVAKPEPVRPVTDEPDGQPPDPAMIKPKPAGDDEEVLELDADEPSGIHPGAAVGSGGFPDPSPGESSPPPVEPAPLPPPPPARDPSNPFAHLPPAPSDDLQPAGSMFPTPPPPAPTHGVALGGNKKGPPPPPPFGGGRRKGGG